MRAAFIGIGKMGLPMAGNVLGAGHDLTVFNRTLERCDPLLGDGASVATSAAEAVRDAEVLVTMLADPAAVESQILADEAVLADAPEGLVWLEMSTIGPTAARKFASRAADEGVEMLDAPICGSVKDPVSDDAPETLPLGRAAVVREGPDVTLVSVSKGVRDCLRAAEELAGKGVSAEVVDLRCLRPLDTGTVLESVAKTNRVVIVEEGPLVGGWGANLLGILAAEGLHDLDDARVLACPETPIPYSPSLEDAYLPGEGAIVAEVEARLGLAAEIATGA